MNANINLTKQQQQIVFLALFIVGGGGYAYWNYLLKPTFNSIQKNEKEYKDLVAKIEKSRRQARRLPALQSQVEKLKAELAELEKQLPTDKNLPEIIRTLTREAISENLEFKVLTPPESPTKRTYFEIIPLDITFEGQLNSLARFMASLGQQDRIFKATNLTLTKIGGNISDGALLTIKVLIETYAYTG